MHASIKYLLLLAFVVSGQVQVISQSSVLENLPDHGWGEVERVKNETEFSIKALFDKHTTHDAMAEGAIVQLISLDSRHGKNGKFYTLRKAGKSISFQADGTDPKDPATLFTVCHRLSPNLQSQLGFTHPTANNNFMRFDPITKTIVFDKKDFLDEDAQTSHWEIIGTSIENCYLRNRSTEGILFNFKGKVEFKLEPDQETVSFENALWGISYQSRRELQARLDHHVRLEGPAAANLNAKARERDKKDMWLYGWDTRNRVKREEREAQAHLDNIRNIIQKTQQELNAFTPGGAIIYRHNHKSEGNPWEQLPGLLNSISVRTDNDAWGTNASGNLFHWDGKNWVHIPTRVAMKNVSVNAPGQVWCVSTDNKPWIKTETGFTPGPTDGLPGEKMVVVALRNDQEVWAMGGEKDWQLYIYTGSDWKKNSPPNTIITSVSVSDSGEVWAVDSNGMVWKSKEHKTWEAVNCPAPLQSIAVRNKNDVWGASKSCDIFHWDGKGWAQVPGKLDYLAVGSGVSIKTIPGKSEFKEIEAASTITPDGKPYPPNDAARIKFQIVKQGMGGGIPPGATPSFIRLPVAKHPQFIGFARDTIPDIDPSSLLKVNPLLTRGTAWLDTAFKTPGKTSISFLARPKDQGDVQIVFGQNISDNYVWRIIIGGWKNTKAAIVRRRYEGNEAIDDIVCEVTKEQNPLAATFPGNFTPYWVSIDNGLILVGMGELGENIFLAWRDPHPPDDVNQVGFGSYKQPVEYTQIQLGSPVVAQNLQRIYFPTKAKTQATSQPITASPAKDSFVWSQYPFRTSDNGSICFEIQGKDQAVIALGKDPQNGTEHYALIFGDADKKGNRGLALKRWNSDTKQYKDLYFLKEESFPDLAIDPTHAKKFWISFNYGQIMIGQGDLGQKVLLVFQDFGPLDSIDAIGFGSFGTTPTQIRHIQIAPPVTLGVEKKAEGYKRGKEMMAFKGSVTLIIPFEYKFSQEGQSVRLDDLVNNRTYYPGATPQQGAIYSFMFTILSNGAPKMDWTKAPANPQEIKLQRELVKADATIALEQAKAEAIRKSGAIDKSIMEAEAAKTTAGIETARTVTSAASQAGAALAAAGPIGAAVGIGISTASTLAFGVTAGILGSQAAKQQFKGAELEAQAHRKALDKEAEVAQLEYQKKLLQGEANFAFRSHDSYVYTDKPERPELGSASIPPDAIKNKTELLELLNQADTINPTDTPSVQSLLTLCQNMLLKINHYHTISEHEIKQRLFRNFEKLVKTSQPNKDLYPDVVGALFSAYNNSFLVNEANPDEAVKKATWLRSINLFARTMLQQPTVDLNSYYGEYIWYPKTLPQPGAGTFSFEASGINDLIICFTNDTRTKIRNTDKEIYEIVIGGWDNNKAAIRIKSLGKSVKETTFEENQDIALNPNDFEKYWVSINNGLISVGRGAPGQNRFLSWKDPYPIDGVRYIGLSSWNAPVSIKNMQVAVPLALQEAPKSRRVVHKPKRVPVGTAKVVPSDSAEVAKLEGEEPDIEQEPEEVVEGAGEAEASPETTEAEGEITAAEGVTEKVEDPNAAEAIEVGVN